MAGCVKSFGRWRSCAGLSATLSTNTRERSTVSTPNISVPHNLPSLQPFFGREDELRKIADALDPESR
jgi:hypothetical protein